MRSMIIVEPLCLSVLLCCLITHSLCLRSVWVLPKNDTIMPRVIVNEKAEKLWLQDPVRAAEFRKVLDDFAHVLWEVYCPPRVAPLWDPGLGNTESLDLMSAYNGTADSVQLKTVLRKNRQHGLKVVLLSPPCTWFSTLMYSNWYRMLVEKRELGAKEGVWHLGFSMAMAKKQCDNRR